MRLKGLGHEGSEITVDLPLISLTIVMRLF